MDKELIKLLKRAYDEGSMYEATLSSACSFENFCKDLEKEAINYVSITLCGCGGKKYKQRVLEMDFLTCEECGISKPA